MYSTSKTKQTKYVDLIVLSHYFTFEEYLVARNALKGYTPSVWAPINSEAYSPELRSQNREFYQEIGKLFENYSAEWAFSPEEKMYVKQALLHFMCLPLPLYGSFEEIRKRKKDRKVAKRVVEYLE